MTNQGKSPNDISQVEILYIEDDVYLAGRVKRELLEAGYKGVDHCKTWESAEKLLKEKGTIYDAAILDIELQNSPLDGIDIANILYNNLNIVILVVTGFADTRTMKRLSLIPTAGYIFKPASGDQIDASLRRLLEMNTSNRLNRTIQDSFKGQRLQEMKINAPLVSFVAAAAEKVEFNDILYIEASRGEVLVHMNDGRARPLSMGIDKAIRFFGRDDLIRVHKSYAVPYHSIKRVTYKEIELVNGGKIPVGDRHRGGLR